MIKKIVAIIMVAIGIPLICMLFYILVNLGESYDKLHLMSPIKFGFGIEMIMLIFAALATSFEYLAEEFG